MADHITAKQRSALMSRVRGRDTRPEKLVRSTVHRLGYRFRIGPGEIPGRPDLVLPRHQKAIFVHGCFWHQHEGCVRASRPKSRKDFWNRKLDRNIERDIEVGRDLSRAGWFTLVVWECETKDPKSLELRLSKFLRRKRRGVRSIRR